MLVVLQLNCHANKFIKWIRRMMILGISKHESLQIIIKTFYFCKTLTKVFFIERFVLLSFSLNYHSPESITCFNIRRRYRNFQTKLAQLYLYAYSAIDSQRKMALLVSADNRLQPGKLEC